LHGTAQIIAAYLKNNGVPAARIGQLIRAVHHTLAGLADGQSVNGRSPAVPVAQSITPDFLICLEDGRRLKTLRRYLRVAHQLTPEAYRERWSLPANYPMVAPNYARSRSEFAKRIGLGRRDKAARGTAQRGATA
jgi:predicted transcriptional regulator